MSIDLGLYLTKRRKEKRKPTLSPIYTSSNRPYDPILYGDVVGVSSTPTRSCSSASDYSSSDSSSSSSDSGGGSSCD